MTDPGDSTLPPVPAPRWDLREAPDSPTIEALVAALSLPAPLCAVLAARGIRDGEEARRFLRPRLEDLHPPEALADADRAAGRLDRAIQASETIFVHGDYDVDGVCAAALLTRGLRSLGGRVVPFVPHRLRDGYDLGRSGVERAHGAGATLLVTCDSGIVAHEAVAQANALGLDVVITDHHTPGDRLPDAFAVVNPKRADCRYPEKGLCGTAVVFQLLRHLTRKRTGEQGASALLEHLDLVALATIADLVPLRGENRILTRFGLRYLAGTRKVGLRELLAVSGLDDAARPDPLTAADVGFKLAPRINAVGRMGDAGDALELLLSEDRERASALAARLDAFNQDRREEDQRTFDEAVGGLADRFDPEVDFGVVVAGEGWHPGVIGIVASRVVERVHRPVVVVALDGERGRGSARSIPGVDLHRALTDCRTHLDRFGGHRQAAGMDLEAGALGAFREAFNAAVRTQLSGAVPPPSLRADLVLPLAAATEDLHHWMEYLGPFGIGNPRPVFISRGEARLGPAREVGRGHLKLRVGRNGAALDAIGFGLAGRVRPETLPEHVDLAYQLRENEYRGRRTLQARLLDVRPSGGG